MQKTKSQRFRQLIDSDQVEFALEAHSALSARIVQEAGFQAVWASSLSLSAAMGLRDSNELSWTQVIEAIEFMSDATEIPILLDADTGYGNFNNVRKLIPKLEQRGVAAVCIEDKLFPKTNSFINSESQVLADIDEFCGRIKAAKDVQKDPSFAVIARIESFIAGRSLKEALDRANAYYESGADAILIHSKSKTADQIVSFMKEWRNKCPVIIVPTTYHETPIGTFEELGVSMIIWSNYMVRASIRSMQRVAHNIEKMRSVSAVEKDIVPIKEIFRLQNTDELEEAENKYLPGRLHPASSTATNKSHD